MREESEVAMIGNVATMALVGVLVAVSLCSCASGAGGEPGGAPPARSLKDAFAGRFHVGAALGGGLFREPGQPTLGLVARQFGTISPENVLKWGPFNPRSRVYNHEGADAFVKFGRRNGMFVVGHVLFWHSQTPDWVFEDSRGKPIGREALLKRMRERVRHVASRYRKHIDAWDVVNEAILDNGKMRKSKWLEVLGDGWIEDAFRIAGEELPRSTKLLYNDYSMTMRGRRDAVVRLVRELKRKKIRIDGVGMQGHWSIGGPSVSSIEKSIVAFHEAGVGVHITELDIDVLPRKAGMWGSDVARRLEGDPSMDPYRDGLPGEMQRKLARRYADLFRLFLKHSDKIERVTFWGVTDRHSWLNNWPIKGRTNHPLLFDRAGRAKPAFDAVIEVAKGTR